MPEYIKAKHFSDEEPSVVLPNVKKPELRVVQKGRDGISRWATVDKDETIERMVSRGIDELEDTYEALRIKAYAAWAKQEGMDADGFDKRPAYKKIKKDVETVLLQSRRTLPTLGEV